MAGTVIFINCAEMPGWNTRNCQHFIMKTEKEDRHMELPVPTHLQQFLIPAGDKNSEYEVTGNVQCTCGSGEFEVRERRILQRNAFLMMNLFRKRTGLTDLNAQRFPFPVKNVVPCKMDGRFWRQCRSAENNRINVMLSERMEINLYALFFSLEKGEMNNGIKRKNMVAGAK